MVFATDGFFEVAIESWPEWDLNPREMLRFKTTKLGISGQFYFFL